MLTSVEGRPLDVSNHRLHVEPLDVGIIRAIEIEEVEFGVEAADRDVVGGVGLHRDLANVG